MNMFEQDTVSTSLVPRQIVFGDGSSQTAAAHLQNWSVPPGQVLVVADAAISSMGVLDSIRGSLEENGFPCTLFEKIAGEPDLAIAHELADWARREPFSAVLGVGGGSAMDMAKLAAAFAVNSGRVEDYSGAATFVNSPLPLALVPTTAGTGSEATSVAMFSIEGKKSIILSPQLVPLLAILDPLLTKSLPANMTAATGLDALSHAIEAAMSTRAGPYTDLHVHKTCQLVASHLKTVYHDGTQLASRRAMLFAAHCGGVCLNAGVVLGHSVAYTISNRTNLPHGTCCAMSLPFVIAYNSAAVHKRLAALAGEAIGLADADPRGLVLWTSTLTADLGIPLSLRDAALSEDYLDAMIAECLKRYPRPNNPVPLEEKRLSDMYRAFLEGDPLGYYDRVVRQS